MDAQHNTQMDAQLDSLCDDTLRLIVKQAAPMERYTMRFVCRRLYDASSKYGWILPRTMAQDAIATLDLYKWYTVLIGPPDDVDLENAMINGDLEVVKYIISCGVSIIALPSEVYAYENIVKYLQSNVETFKKHVSMHDAIKSGNLEVIKYLHECGYPWPAECLRTAIIAKRIDIVRHLCENGCQYRSCRVTEAVRSLEIAKYLVGKYGWGKHYNIQDAIQSNNVDTVKYYHECGCDITCNSVRTAVVYGNVEILKYICDINPHLLQQCMHETDLMMTAIRYDNINMVKYLHNNGYACNDPQYAVCAAHGDNLDILRYLHEAGCKLTKEATLNIHSLEVMKYLHENGCEWHPDAEIDTDDCCDRLIVPMLIYASKIGVTCADSMHMAIVEDDFDAVVYFSKHFTAIDARNVSLCENIEILKYLHKMGHNMNNHETMQQAIIEYNFEIVKYLHENGCDFNNVHIQIAIEAKNKCILEYIKSNWWRQTTRNIYAKISRK